MTYKNVPIRMKNGKTRMQRARVLASGKLRFVKNLGRRKPRKTTSKGGKRTVVRKRARAAISRSKKVLGNYGATGLLEDAAIGYFGTSVLMGMGYPIESAMPMTRVVQGAVGKALNRRGKGRLAYGVIDLIDVYLIKRGFNLQEISLKAWM